MSIINLPVQVGQKVRICTEEELIKRYPRKRDDIISHKSLNDAPCTFVSKMYSYLGQKYEVSEVSTYDKRIFKLKGNPYWWDITVTVPLYLEEEIDKRSLPHIYRK